MLLEGMKESLRSVEQLRKITLVIENKVEINALTRLLA